MMISLGMDLICVTECDDCGLGLVIESSFVTVTELAGQYNATTLCQFCERLIITDVTKEQAIELKNLGVEILNWEL